MSRVIAGLLLLFVAFAVPGEALAHGEAHHRHHEADHQAAHAADVSVSVVSAPESDHDHQHPRLDSVNRTRLETAGLVMRPAALVLTQNVAVSAPARPLRRDVLSPGDPHTGPPPRLRAPPVR